jgi:hypothetical protein
MNEWVKHVASACYLPYRKQIRLRKEPFAMAKAEPRTERESIQLFYGIRHFKVPPISIVNGYPWGKYKLQSG